MTTELSFLIELLLKHKIPPATKLAVADRIKEVEQGIGLVPKYPVMQVVAPKAQAPIIAQQSASMQALMEKHPDWNQHPVVPDQAPPAPVAVIAQTPATIDAMEKRAAIMAGKNPGTNPATGRPRKF